MGLLRGVWRRTASLLKDTWAFEVFGIFVSAIASGALVGILWKYNHAPLFDWHGITLNTVVSIISTISKTLLMFTVAAAISQWKYVVFSEKQKLIDFDTLDSARDSPLGSIILLIQVALRKFLRGDRKYKYVNVC